MGKDQIMVPGAGADGPKLATALFNRRLPEHLDAKLVLAFHDELVVRSLEEQAEKMANLWRGLWSPGWTRSSTPVW